MPSRKATFQSESARIAIIHLETCWDRDFSPAILFVTQSIVFCSGLTTHCFQTCLSLTYSVRRE